MGRLVRKTANVEVISHSVDLKIIKRNVGKPSGKFQHIRKNKNIRIISVGRLDEQKDFYTVLKAFCKITKRIPNCDLLVVGDGYLKDNLMNYSKKLGIEKKTHFTGWVRNIYKYLKDSDLFLFSSNYEGFGMVIVESMAMGVPVVATDSPFGPREILQNGKYGVLVPVGDYESMAEKTVNLLKDKKKLKKYSEAGIKISQKYSVEKMLKSYERLFLHLVNNG